MVIEIAVNRCEKAISSLEQSQKPDNDTIIICSSKYKREPFYLQGSRWFARTTARLVSRRFFVSNLIDKTYTPDKWGKDLLSTSDAFFSEIFQFFKLKI